jgi:hypothetical protein
VTVRPGSAWGDVVAVPDGALDVRGDVELAAAIERAESRPLVVSGGDLYRTTGSPTAPGTAVRVPIDVLEVIADGVAMTAVAHVVARRPGRFGWWRGRVVAVMNAEHIGRWDVAPRSHPNDGRFDLVDVAASMSLRERWQASRRLRTGTHVPHPCVASRRSRLETFTFDRPMELWLDGVTRGTVRSLSVSVVPDAAEIFIGGTQ